MQLSLLKNLSVCLGISLLCCQFSACDGDIVASGDPELVIEGWIENDKNPCVIVSSTMPLTDEFQYSKDLDSYIVKSAEVIVSDGEKQFVLKGVDNQSYIPSYVYSTSELVGEIGRSYTLTVNYKQFHATAVTSILDTPKVDSLLVIKYEHTDSLYQVKAFITDNDKAATNYYKIFTMTRPEESSYFSYVGSAFIDKALSLYDGINVYPGQKFTKNHYNSNFMPSDSLYIKITQIDEFGYKYWKDFEDMFVTVSNPLFPVRFNVRSNIKGGRGIWCGYGVVEKRIIFDDIEP